MGAIHHIAEATKLWAQTRQLAVSFQEDMTSTNDLAKSEAHSLSEPLKLYLAGHQTHGRGRGQNTWLDTGAGEALLSSWSCKIDQAPQPIAAPLIGLALFDSVRIVWPSCAWSLKAPNDIYLGANKMGGLLVENVTEGPRHRLIIGLGLNILNHPRSIANATSLISEDGLRGELADEQWFQWLDVFLGKIKASFSAITQSELSVSARQHLLSALNANPNMKEPVLDVSPQGDLKFAKRTQPWSAL